MALSTRRRDRSYPTPMGPGFDDSNRERGIAQSQGIASLPSSIIPFRTSETPRENFISRTQGGNKDRDFNTSDSLYNLFRKYKSTPTEQGLQQFRDEAEDFFDPDPGLEVTVPVGDLVRPAGLFGPGAGLGDPTGEGGIIQKLGEFLGLTDPIDPENEGLPMDEFQEYDPNNPNMFMLPEGMDLDDMPMEDIINQMRKPQLQATADTYSLPNLLQMINDAGDAGNVDELELLTNDLEMMYPGATTTI